MTGSLRAYARHRGQTLAAVQKAIATGRIVREENGEIDYDKADAAWPLFKAGPRPNGRGPLQQMPPERAPQPPRISSPLGDSAAGKLTTARATKAAYDAGMAKLKYERALAKHTPDVPRTPEVIDIRKITEDDVRSIQGLDHIGHPLKRAMLITVARVLSVRKAAKLVGIGRSTHHLWVHEDDQYARCFELAKVQGAQVLEDEAVRRGVEGVDEPIYQMGELVGTKKVYSDALLIFTMKGTMPEKYRERYGERKGALAGRITLAQLDELMGDEDEEGEGQNDQE